MLSRCWPPPPVKSGDIFSRIDHSVLTLKGSSEIASLFLCLFVGVFFPSNVFSGGGEKMTEAIILRRWRAICSFQTEQGGQNPTHEESVGSSAADTLEHAGTFSQAFRPNFFFFFRDMNKQSWLRESGVPFAIWSNKSVVPERDLMASTLHAGHEWRIALSRASCHAQRFQLFSICQL